MTEYKIEDLTEKYDIDFGKIVDEIKSKKARTVLLQFPEGLKPWATLVENYLEKETDAKFSIWLGNCFGACDIPNSSADLLIQFGHAPWGTGFDQTK